MNKMYKIYCDSEVKEEKQATKSPILPSLEWLLEDIGVGLVWKGPIRCTSSALVVLVLYLCLVRFSSRFLASILSADKA